MKFELREIKNVENEDVYQMFQEIPAEENGFLNPAFGLSYNEFRVFCQQQVDNSMGKNLKPGYVPGTYYLLFADNKPAGLVKLRHFLNDKLRKDGGHIGYGVRPSCRGQGLGKILLREVLKYARAKGLDKVLLTIRDDNLCSRKVCESNGGMLEKVVPTDQGYGKCFYWIKL